MKGVFLYASVIYSVGRRGKGGLGLKILRGIQVVLVSVVSILVRRLGISNFDFTR